MANAPVQAAWQAHFYHISNQQLSIHISNTPVFIQRQRGPHISFHHTIIAFTISSLLAFLQIKSSGLTFTERLFVISILGYNLAFRARFQFPTFASQFTIVMAVLGSFSAASLVSLLLPNSSWVLKCIVYIVPQLCELYQILQPLHYRGWGGLFCRRPPPPYMSSTRQLLPQTYMDLGGYAAHDRRHGTLSRRRIPLSSN